MRESAPWRIHGLQVKDLFREFPFHPDSEECR